VFACQHPALRHDRCWLLPGHHHRSPQVRPGGNAEHGAIGNAQMFVWSHSIAGLRPRHNIRISCCDICGLWMNRSALCDASLPSRGADVADRKRFAWYGPHCRHRLKQNHPAFLTQTVWHIAPHNRHCNAGSTILPLSFSLPLRFPTRRISTVNACLHCCWRRCCPDTSRYQRGQARQKNALPTTTAPCWNPRGRRSRRCAF